MGFTNFSKSTFFWFLKNHLKIIISFYLIIYMYMYGIFLYLGPTPQAQ